MTNAFHGALSLREVEQLEDYGLVLAEQVAVGDAKQQGVSDLTGGAGNGNALCGLGHESSPNES